MIEYEYCSWFWGRVAEVWTPGTKEIRFASGVLGVREEGWSLGVLSLRVEGCTVESTPMGSE